MHQAATFDRFNPANVDDPYPLYDRIRSQTPFFDPTLDMWIVARYDDVRAVLGDHRQFSSDFNIRSPQSAPPEVAKVLATGHPEVHVLLNQDPPAHTAVRALVDKSFSPRRVRQLTPMVERVADDLIGGFVDAGTTDLIAGLAWPLPLHVICELLGLPTADALQIRTWIDALTQLTSYGTALPEQVAAAGQSVSFENYLAEFVASRREDPRDDLTSELVAAADPALTDQQMISLLISLIFAGHETTANLIGNTLLALLRTEAQSFASAELDIGQAVEETLRRDPPVQGMFRRASTQVEIGDVTIPAGAMVFALIGAANRDPAVFGDPHLRALDRSGPPHLAFGRGVHFCLGAQVAKVEARVAISAALTRLPGLRLAATFQPPYLPNLMHRGPRRLEARWDPGARTPSG